LVAEMIHKYYKNIDEPKEDAESVFRIY
jgi:hypothetical protein